MGQKRMTQEEFDMRLDALPQRDLEGNQYDFKLSIYDGENRPTIVNCLMHGEFEPTPRNILNGQRCPACKEGIWDSKICIIVDGNTPYPEK